ncbi:MAG TPA: ParB N-terminal domain-containing protein, partial [candidate division Zixibacteria bacterium]|nr:ParB N-terminal domain-containing protein [candidate division Zixibacteria bacterium]
MSKQALGRGLGALIPGMAEEAVAEGRMLKEIEIASISPNPYQPRVDFNDDALLELSLSIAEKGVLQ